MYDRQTGKGVMMFVPNRDEATLLSLIQQYVRHGSTIYTDGRAAYNNTSNHGVVVQEDGVVVHEENFVDPEAGVHAQSSCPGQSMKSKLYTAAGCLLSFLTLKNLCGGSGLGFIASKPSLHDGTHWRILLALSLSIWIGPFGRSLPVL